MEMFRNSDAVYITELSNLIKLNAEFATQGKTKNVLN